MCLGEGRLAMLQGIDKIHEIEDTAVIPIGLQGGGAAAIALLG